MKDLSLSLSVTQFFKQITRSLEKDREREFRKAVLWCSTLSFLLQHRVSYGWPVWVQAIPFWSSSQLICLKRQWKKVQVLGPRKPCRRSGWNSWLLPWTWLSLSQWMQLGSEPEDERFSLSLAFCACVCVCKYVYMYISNKYIFF